MFTTLLAPLLLLAATPAPARRFGVYGDTRDNDAEHGQVVARLVAAHPQLVLFTGDAVMDGTSSELWKRWVAIEWPLLRGTAIYAVRGNHDTGPEFAQRLALPPSARTPGPEGESYSFDSLDVHFLGLDTEMPLSPGSPQLAFAARDLAEHTGKPIVVFLHRALFSSGNHGGDHDLQMALQPLFDQAHVLAVFQGHDHDYERSQPIHGVTYFVEGGGGAKLRPFEGKSPDWSAFRYNGFGYALVDVVDDGLEVTAYDLTGTALDHVKLPFGVLATVVKERPAPQPVPLESGDRKRFLVVVLALAAVAAGAAAIWAWRARR
jgi:predicted MPP superfamily phosphohydrolase